MRPVHLFLTLLFTLASVAQAQTTKKPQKTTIEARTLCYARSTTETGKLWIQGVKDKGAVDVYLPLESISRRFKCVTLDGKAIFYKEGKVGKNGEPVRIPLGVVKVPSGQTKVLFYFIPNTEPDAKMPYEVKVFSDDYSKFPLGHTRVINLNKTASKFEIGEHTSEVKPNSVKNFPAVKRRNNFKMGVFRYYQMNRKKKWVKVRDRTAKYTKQKRLLVIACHNPRLKRPDVRIYKDFPQNDPE